MTRQQNARPPRWAVASSVAAVAALVLGWVVGEAVQDQPYDPVTQSISTLARHGADHRWIMTAALAVVGVAHLVTAAGLRGASRPARLVLALGGVAGVGLACCAQPQHGSSDLHLGFAVLGVVVLAVFPLLASSAGHATTPVRRADLVWVAPLSLGFLVWSYVAASVTGDLGVAERIITFQQELWPLLVVLALRHESAETVARSVPYKAERLAA